MALTDRMDLYLKLERIMMEFDDVEPGCADQLRDLMDPIWYELSDAEHEFLDSRTDVDVRVLYPVSLSVPDLYRTPPEGLPASVAVAPDNGVGTRFKLEEAFQWVA
jgi:hypothetical protein